MGQGNHPSWVVRRSRKGQRKKRSMGLPKEHGNMRPLLKEGHVHTPHQNAKGDSGNGKCKLPTPSTSGRDTKEENFEQVLRLS
ncbi:hypothetical protein Tco_0504517 [Tanacetum coccineum]